jgi:hypothetical protein
MIEVYFILIKSLSRIIGTPAEPWPVNQDVYQSSAYGLRLIRINKEIQIKEIQRKVRNM